MSDAQPDAPPVSQPGAARSRGTERAAAGLAGFLASIALAVLLAVALGKALTDGTELEDAVTSQLGWFIVALVVVESAIVGLVVARRTVP